MGISNPYQTYQKLAATTARPEDLTMMLYEGLVKFIRLAKAGIEQNDITQSHANNIKAQNILTELIVTLRPEYEISQSLHSMYDYMKSRLVEANISKNNEILDEVELLASELAETWSQAIKQKA